MPHAGQLLDIILMNYILSGLCDQLAIGVLYNCSVVVLELIDCSHCYGNVVN